MRLLLNFTKLGSIANILCTNKVESMKLDYVPSILSSVDINIDSSNSYHSSLSIRSYYIGEEMLTKSKRSDSRIDACCPGLGREKGVINDFDDSIYKDEQNQTDNTNTDSCC